MATKFGLSGQPDVSDDGEIRLGSLALKTGWVTPEQLREALSLQAKDALAGRPPRLLGAIFMSEQFLTQEQLDFLLRQQEQRRAQGQS